MDSMQSTSLFIPWSSPSFNKLASGCGWDVIGTCGSGEHVTVPLQKFSLQRPTVLVIGELVIHMHTEIIMGMCVRVCVSIIS